MTKQNRMVDVPISENRDIPLEANQRIVGVSITNQGTHDIKCAMGSSNAVKWVRANSDVSYGDVNGPYLVGNLIIESTDWPNSDIVLTWAYDVTGAEEDC